MTKPAGCAGPAFYTFDRKRRAERAGGHMITDKQRQRDYEYDGDYQSKSRYTEEQWNNILSSGQLSEEDIHLLKQIYSSYNHAATLLQLAFHNKTTEEDILSQVNAMGELLAAANDIRPEVDFSGNEYWWFLYFWGKNTDAGTLEQIGRAHV